MKRVQGNPGAALIECVSPAKDKWRVRWDVQASEDGLSASYMEEELAHKPSDDEIRAVITAWVNEQTDRRILTGFSWNDEMVWLSQENQFNYKAAYDLAIMTNGDSLPVTFKFGTDEQPCYHTFDRVDTLDGFYRAAIAHVQQTIADGWALKRQIDMAAYHVD